MPRSGSRQCSTTSSTSRRTIRPHRARQLPARHRGHDGRVHQRARHVVLRVPDGGVADADGPRAAVAAQVRQLDLLGRVVAVDAHEVLQAPVPARGLDEEREEVVGLPARIRARTAPGAPRQTRGRTSTRRSQLRSPRGTRGSDVVGAAAIAPVGEYVSALSVSALRWRCARHGWSGNRPLPTHCRQCAEVESTAANASSTLLGATPSSHVSATNARSPSRSRARAAARPPSIPRRKLVVSPRVSDASAARALAAWYPEAS